MRTGVYPDKSIDDEGRERFHPLEIDRHLNGPIYEWIYRYAANFAQQGSNCCGSSSISFHYVKPQTAEKLENSWKALKKNKNNSANFDELFIAMLKNLK